MYREGQFQFPKACFGCPKDTRCLSLSFPWQRHSVVLYCVLYFIVLPFLLAYHGLKDVQQSIRYTKWAAHQGDAQAAEFDQVQSLPEMSIPRRILQSISWLQALSNLGHMLINGPKLNWPKLLTAGLARSNPCLLVVWQILAMIVLSAKAVSFEPVLILQYHLSHIAYARE